MSSEAITQNDLREILSRTVGSIPSEYKKLLWTNPSPTTAYTSGTPVSADVASQYDAIEISFMLWTGYQSICAVDTAVKGQAMITTSIASSNNYVSGSRPDPLARAWDFTAQNGVRIYGGVEANFAVQGAYAQANHVLIPYQIYGIKYERVAPPQVDASDYVIEQGTSGIWTYRKWESGIAECWGTHSATASVTTAWGYTFYGSVDMPNFPSIFIATPSRQATLSTPGGYAWLVPNSSNLSSTSPGGMYIFSGTSVSSVSCTISVHAIGRWK